jgi:hypothetical protein
MQTRERENGEGIVLMMPNGVEIEIAPWRGNRALKIWVKGAGLLIKPQGTSALELVLEEEATAHPAEPATGSPSTAP